MSAYVELLEPYGYTLVRLFMHDALFVQDVEGWRDLGGDGFRWAESPARPGTGLVQTALVPSLEIDLGAADRTLTATCLTSIELISN